MDKPSDDLSATREQGPTPVVEHATAPNPNPAAQRSLWTGLLLFVPFSGVLAIRDAKRGRKIAAMTGVGGSAATAGLVLGSINIALWIAILASLPAVLMNERRKAQRTACASQLRQLALLMQLYCNDNKGVTPPSLDQLATTSSPSILICPACSGTSKPSVSSSAHGACSYIYQTPHYATHGDWVEAGLTVAIYEPLTNHDGYGSAFAFFDGHVEFLDPARSQKMIAELNAGFNPPRAEKLK